MLKLLLHFLACMRSWNVFFLTELDCHRNFLIIAMFNTTLWRYEMEPVAQVPHYEPYKAEWHVFVTAQRRWQWLLACSSPWHSGPITISEKTQTIPSPPEECDAICSQVWLIPAEQSRPHHTNECRQEITKGARLSLFHTASCFHNQIIPIFFLPVSVCVTQMLFF